MQRNEQQLQREGGAAALVDALHLPRASLVVVPKWTTHSGWQAAQRNRHARALLCELHQAARLGNGGIQVSMHCQQQRKRGMADLQVLKPLRVWH
jgi:hypothetical protein